ncbi:TetR/AcrR family transcriptional regulator [Actinoplanes sp. TBRC 11911]|uniref:TetR/AcrR family transcriptional regulator n=1 Tax=Actinoplanes sp. TBRC 11911 TaxID=2729386 RepID=UPI00145F0E39|nr:TetR/AcrR family transcriptional regulator [Actinoplanes sp. TBRC 11911]NMO49684.1 TetR/AcrR family transcriptional regulator [Actinoplanes sp. TBRC 11911]
MTARHRNAPVGLPESEVLAHGLDAFAELGYDATSVRELAKRLEVSHNFINDRYASKAGFWRAVIDEAMRPRMARMESMVADAAHTDEQRLRHIVAELYRDAADLYVMNRIIADESGRDSDRLDYLTEHFIGPVFELWRPLLVRLLPDVPPETVFFAITGPALALTHEPLARRLSGTGEVTPAERAARAEDLARLVLDGLLPRLSSPAS